MLGLGLLLVGADGRRRDMLFLCGARRVAGAKQADATWLDPAGVLEE